MPQPLLKPQLVHMLPARGSEAGMLHLLAKDALADGIGREGEQAGIVVLLALGVVGLLFGGELDAGRGRGRGAAVVVVIAGVCYSGGGCGGGVIGGGCWRRKRLGVSLMSIFVLRLKYGIEFSLVVRLFPPCFGR